MASSDVAARLGVSRRRSRVRSRRSRPFHSGTVGPSRTTVAAPRNTVLSPWFLAWLTLASAQRTRAGRSMFTPTESSGSTSAAGPRATAADREVPLAPSDHGSGQWRHFSSDAAPTPYGYKHEQAIGSAERGAEIGSAALHHPSTPARTGGSRDCGLLAVPLPSGVASS